MDAVKLPWPRSPRRCEENSTSTAQRLPGQGLTDHEARDRKHRKGIHGDAITQKKDDGNVRILLQNPGGIGFVTGQRNRESYKMDKLKKFIIEKQVDIVGLTEVNKDWRCVPTDNTVWAATAPWRETRKIQTSNNTTGQMNREHQIGGTITMAFDEVSYHVSDRNQDERGLGRWSWMELNGVGGTKTTIITAYCPVNSSGLGGCYTQHLTYMSLHRSEPESSCHFIPESIVCPRQLFGYDLHKFVDGCIEEGNQIILMGDFNSEYSILREWMLDLSLLDVIGKKHGYEDVPRTHTRSKDSPIDCIFASAQISCAIGGFLSFGKLDGDHRGLWVDIPKMILLGCNIPPHTHPGARRLKLHDPRTVDRYLELLHDYMCTRNIYHRMNHLHSVTVYPLPLAMADQYERLDDEICECMDLAEKKCRKFRMGAVKFSPTYKAAVQTVELWKRRLAHRNGGEHNVRKILVLQNKLGLPYDPTLATEDIIHKLHEARVERRRCKTIDESLSMEYRFQLAEAKEAAGTIKAAVHLRNMNRVEEIRTLFRNIRYMEGKIRAGASAQITVTNADGSFSELTDKDEVEAAIIKSNERKYHQTEGGSQLLEPFFTQDIGTCGDGPKVNEILNGTYLPPPASTDATIAFLEACKRPDNFIDATHQSAPTRYWNQVRTWRQRKEKTTSANQHIGHFKAVMTHSSLSWLFFQRAEIPTISGYSPSRHRTCVDLMIMKKANSFQVEKQRTLGILDSEFNHSNRDLQHEAMQSALRNDCIAVEQYSRPNRSCICHALNRRLTADDRQSKRLAWAMAMSDLTGCYDRIVHNAAALVLLRLGLSHAKIHSMFTTIQRMVHRVRTAFGDSETTYGGDDFENWLFAPQGILQGNASGPAIWTIISSLIFDILRSKGHSDRFCSAISKELFLLVGFAYVDDCDLIQSGQDPLEVAKSMQTVVQQWGDLMEVTGGALNLDPSKSYWYMVEYVWKHGKWCTSDADIGDFDLVARNADGDYISLTRLNCDDESEMLGLWMSPSGNNKKMINSLRLAAVNWAAKLRLGRSSQAEAWKALNTTISRKLMYPLPALTLTEKECTYIMAPAIRTALPKAGISSCISSIVRHAPIQSLGLEVPNLYTAMGTARTSLLVEHCWQKTPTGQLLQIAIENLVLDVGLFGHIWDNTRFASYSQWCSQHSWLYSVCSFNNEQEILLSIKHAQLHPKRINDRALMDMASEFLHSTSELRAFNRVRMLHKVVSLADITSANGKGIDRIFTSSSEFEGSRNNFEWPSKHHVSSGDFTVWRKALEYMFPNEQLVLPLGSWILTDPADWLEYWEWFATLDGEFLYFREGPSVWHRFLKRPNSHHSYFGQFLVEDAPIAPLRRATIEGDVNTLFLLNSSLQPILATPDTPEEIQLGECRVLAPSIAWVTAYMRSSPSIQLLLDDIAQGKAVAVGDGSYFEIYGVGSAAWILSSADGSSWIEGGGIVPGPISDLNSYRCELGALLGIGVGTACLKNLLPTTKHFMITACDNLEALRKSTVDRTKVKTTWKSVDLISQILDVWSNQHCTQLPQHVYGHQDDKRTGPLTFVEQLNVRMDKLAKTLAIRSFGQVVSIPSAVPLLGMSKVMVKGSLVVSNFQKSLAYGIHHNDMVEYIADKWEIDATLLHDTVAWPSIAKARKSASFPFQRFISKWISEDTATGIVMRRRKQRVLANCPRCDAPEEHLVHILTCPHPDVQTLTTNLLVELELWLTQEDTYPHIIPILIDSIRSWLSDPYGNEPHIVWPTNLIRVAFNAQRELGWYAFLMGFITKPIVSMQNSYYSTIQSRKKGSTWATRLIVKCWNIVYHLWTHRNSVLHESQVLASLSGLDALRASISAEYAVGRSSLHPVYTRYFTTTLETILLRPPDQLKLWFLLIRSGREALHIRTPDTFSTNATLRNWIGLPPIQT